MNDTDLAKIGRRIHVVGSSGSGKTTLARQISETLDCPHIEIDQLNWRSNWVDTPTDELREKVANALSGSCWVIDGNYSRLRDIVWERADTIIWLDLGFLLILQQILSRTIRRIVKKELLWAGNQESFRMAFFSKDSVILWFLQTHKRHQKVYPGLFSQSENKHLAAIRISSNKEKELLLHTLRKLYNQR